MPGNICQTPARFELQTADLDNGSYEVSFTPPSLGTFCLKVFIFSRPIKNCPLLFTVSRHNSPTGSFGRHGWGEEGFVQPCSLAMAREKIYVMDTGNSRIKVLHSNLVFSHHISCEQLEGRSVTGGVRGEVRWCEDYSIVCRALYGTQ